MMSFVHTKECRNLIRRREKLEAKAYFPSIRHLIYLIDDYIAKKIEMETLGLKRAQLEERIYCAKEFIKVLRQNE